MSSTNWNIGVIGAGSMGSGIAQVAATQGHRVFLMEQSAEVLKSCREGHAKILARLVEKGKLKPGEDKEIIARIHYGQQLSELSKCDMIIEAIVERLEVKKSVFTDLEKLVSDDCILASNTSSLSIASIASALAKPERCLGIHFFNPAPLMPLVEIIPAVQTDAVVTKKAVELIDSWGKTTVITKDTPGFIVNRLARPFYGEAVRILEEGMADVATIDWAMTELGGFKMGPFTLMDFIGHDVNYAVTESVFAAFYYDPRYKPNLSQRRLVEAGWLGRKTGRGFYDYREGAVQPQPQKDEKLGREILHRILYMLINEAADALMLNIASAKDLDLAMLKGVNYPKGLLAWADEIGIEKVVAGLDALYAEYHEDRYRCSPMLRRMLNRKKGFFS